MYKSPSIGKPGGGGGVLGGGGPGAAITSDTQPISIIKMMIILEWVIFIVRKSIKKYYFPKFFLINIDELIIYF
jgi:hypothetical protein